MVSVIIPNYNHAPYLQQRIECILHQTYQNFEVVILDDVSADDSKRIIEKYRSHPKVRSIIYNEVNSGSVFKQWDKGIQQAKGEWVWIAESDDWCEANFLETLLSKTDDTCVLAIAQSVVVKDTGEILWKSEATHFTRTYSGQEFIKNRMLLDNFGIPNASMCIFRRSLYFNVDKDFTTYHFCGDWLFWIMIARQGNVFVSGKYLNYFRKHDKDVSGNAYKNGLQYTEHFRLLSKLQNSQIISQNEKLVVLKDRLRMFLLDKRMNAAAHEAINHQLRGWLKMDYYIIVGRYWIKKFLKFILEPLRHQDMKHHIQIKEHEGVV